MLLGFELVVWCCAFGCFCLVSCLLFLLYLRCGLDSARCGGVFVLGFDYDAVIDLVVRFGWVCLMFGVYDVCVNSVDF